jgi:hypothetical protein
MIIVREDGWCIEVYTRDHPPPHVHVRCGKGEVKVSIPPLDEPVALLRVHSLPAHEAVRAVRMVETHRTVLRAAWSEIHD